MPSSAADDEVSAHPSTILIVDDQAVGRTTLKRVLTSDGYHLLTAADGLEALKILESNLVDLVLLDVMMPDMDGFETCRRIRENPLLRELPVLMITSLNDRNSKLKGLMSGADDYITKPIDGAEVRARVRTIVRLNRYRTLIDQSNQLSHLRDFDALTDLPNAHLLDERMHKALQDAQQNNEITALLLIDLDNFDRISQVLGHEAGDSILKEVALRLQRSVRGCDTIARISGDRFAILGNFPHPGTGILRAARAIRSGLEKPFLRHNHELQVTASIGISLYPNDGDNPQTLLQHAFLAMTQAKKHGKNYYQFYSQEMNAAALTRLNLEEDLRKALERHELVLYYQPKVDTIDARLVGVEALVHWEHPVRGWVSPAEFIPLAEESGLIENIGRWVLQQACRDLRHWQSTGLPVVPVAVNFSSRQFINRFGEIARLVASTLEQSGIQPSLLELELTESLLMPSDGDGLEGTLQALHDIRALGAQISIDDFGTGYSSLNYLHRFPVNSLKIDRSFILNLTESQNSAAITHSIVQLAHNLGLKVVAEGVENEQQLAQLRQMGCDFIQGYLYSKALPTDAIIRILRGEHPDILAPEAI
jgi:diguanylate cyclase (GGDEF)-like protein